VYVSALILIAGFALSMPVLAEEEQETGWTDVAELGLVLTTGNSESSSLSINNTLARSWDKSAFTLKAGALRVEVTRVLGADIDTDGFSIVEEDETTAEKYFINGRFDREITEKFFWFAGAGWEKNELAGIKNRYSASGGVGNIWVDTETVKFRTDYSLTYTDQEDVVPSPGVEDNFLGLRFSWNYLHKFTGNTTYGNDFIVDENLDETSDFRADMTNWLAVSMSEKLALKVSLQTLYDNEPSLQVIPEIDGPGSVTIPVDDFDNIFTAALVVNF
jgi:putative salt-induced outer membrane protein YdiY